MNDKYKEIYNNEIKKDNDLWIEVTKDVSPLENRHKVNVQKKQITKTTKHKDEPESATTQNTYSPVRLKSNDIDHKTHKRLKRGQMQIEGRLDLHGMTQNQAYDALLSFIPRAYSAGKRCVLVITGKGNREGTGVLKQKTPQWLNSAPLEQYVLKLEDARPNHGGTGALYVLLRRKR